MKTGLLESSINIVCPLGIPNMIAEPSIKTNKNGIANLLWQGKSLSELPKRIQEHLHQEKLKQEYYMKTLLKPHKQKEEQEVLKTL